MTEERRHEDQRIATLVTDMVDVKACLASNTEITTQVRDMLASFRVIAAVAKWVTKIGAAVAAVSAAIAGVYHGWEWWRGK